MVGGRSDKQREGRERVREVLAKGMHGGAEKNVTETSIHLFLVSKKECLNVNREQQKTQGSTLLSCFSPVKRVLATRERSS